MASAPHAEVLTRLHATLERRAFPERLRASVAGLAKRLGAPVRLAFMGPPGSGKTTLIRALLGPGIPKIDTPLPSHEWLYSEEPHATVTLEDGTLVQLDTIDAKSILDLDPVFVTFHVPCERLRSLRVLELVTDGSDGELAAAAPWAASRCEIPVWCSRRFDDVEAKAWAQVPRGRKDHAVLALTQADRLSPDVLAATMEETDARSETGFYIIAPVAARLAAKAMDDQRGDLERILKSTGIAALRDEILRRVEQGRQQDLDHADVFLNRFEKPHARKMSRPLTAILGQEPRVETSAQTENQAMRESVEYLRAQANEMLTDIVEFGNFAPRKIVDRCLETANTLVDHIADDAPETDAQTIAHNAAYDAADMLLLMTLENTAGAVEDAVNLMLQVKRDFEMAA